MRKTWKRQNFVSDQERTNFNRLMSMYCGYKSKESDFENAMKIINAGYPVAEQIN